MVGRALLVVNPKAGQGRELEQVRERCARAVQADWVESEGARHAFTLAREARAHGYSAVLVAGGDGTLHHVINGLVAGGGGLPLGIIPAGSANDYAKSVPVPLDVEEAWDAIEAGATKQVDLVHVRSEAGEQVLVNAATAGSSEKLNEAVDSDTKRRWRGLAYLRAAVATLPTLEPTTVAIQLDGEAPVRLGLTTIVLANGRYAGGMRLDPEAELDDHLLDVGLVTAEGLGEQLGLLAAYALNRHLESEHVTLWRARAVKLACDPPLVFNIDGEPTPPLSQVSFQVLPAALRVFSAELAT